MQKTEDFSESSRSMQKTCYTGFGGRTYVLQEEVQLWVAGRVDRSFEEGQEDVLQHLLEVGQLLLCLVHIAIGSRDTRRAQLSFTEA